MSISNTSLSNLGLTPSLETYINENALSDFEIGRVITEHKERYIVKTAKGEFDAEITGNMRFTTESREDFPAVGDWVTLQVYDKHMAIIHKILPRFSVIKRKAVGQSGSIQIIATNIDTALLVQAVDRDFNINRLERYLTICYSSNVKPVIVLTKTDLADPEFVDELKQRLKKRIPEVPVIAVSNETQDGIEVIKAIIKPGKTYCMLGSSGVGKSSLLNNLSGSHQMKTDGISHSNNKGRHVTTHRELIVLDKGGILIDNPGMREVGIADSEGGLEATFDKIVTLSEHCKYKDCTHTVEDECAVLEALETDDLDDQVYQNYLKMEKERAHFESTSLERKRKDKELGKHIKNYYKQNIKGRR